MMELVEKMRLTNDERAAIARAIGWLDGPDADEAEVQKGLVAILKRLG
jgi:hypothetical protein